MTNHVLIAGGGIAGLATALALGQRDIGVTVLERRGAFEEIGAGIQLAPNAFAALDKLGVAGQVLERASSVDALRLVDATLGQTIAELDLSTRFRTRFTYPYAVVHRADIHNVLLAACHALPQITLRPNNQVERYSLLDDGVEVALSDGSRLRGQCLIGADGLHSIVRGQVANDGEPRLCGHTTYRAVVSAKDMPAHLRGNHVQLWAGPKCHFVHYPISGGASYNLVVTKDNDAQELLSGRSLSANEVSLQFEEIVPECRALIFASSHWKAWTLADREPLERWSDGPVGLVGDAAHPMVQYAAQGACMALEDAVALGELCHLGTWPQIWSQFTLQRSERTARVQRTARLMGKEVYHPCGSAAAARNALFATLSEKEMHDQLAWLYDGSQTEVCL
ncbi:3-hydroxybenzoate 6-monooxygenase [Aeromonas dhakensis]|uniref:FAD-dependent monooxygenase n=1 Tax=Aeromonas dhakensis TaxID=196024 RepID=UPI0021B34777|nr:FAD-dependent monooxygenase [Aeromonas dhakensis]UXB10080.1 3-hydroxybenzoate 6-monooxygenase [Aeromonas dhakensis]